MLLNAEPQGHEAGHAEHIPWIVEQVNHLLGPAAFSLSSTVMPPIYNLFGSHWPGDGMTYDQFVAQGNLAIPTHVVMSSWWSPSLS